jgi:hypothetical protein
MSTHFTRQTPVRAPPQVQSAPISKLACKASNMILFDLKRWARCLPLLMLAATLTACGGSDDDDDEGIAQVRVINATADLASVDLTAENVDDDASGDEIRHAAAVARDGRSEYSGIASASYRLRLKRAGASSSLSVNAASFAKDERYTVYVYGREGDYRLLVDFEDNDVDPPNAGKAFVRVFNAAPDAGAVDVYLTETDASLNDTVATASAVAGATMGFDNTIDRGAYRLRVTGLNDKEDIRLDVSGIELADRARVTLVLQPGPGGVLVNALLVQYQADVAAVKNSFVRARLVAGASGNAAVTASLGNTSLNVNLRSPSVGSYALVPAGNVAAAVRVNASTHLGGNVELAPGGDYTLAVYGDAAAPEWRLIADDNRGPTDTSRAKMRLLHLAAGPDANLTLVKDFVGVALDVPYGNASVYNTVTAGNDARIEVTSPLSVTPLFLDEEIDLPSRSVFTVFMLGGAAAPTGILRRERQ